jgi:carboxyl-terminal processing protease
MSKGRRRNPEFCRKIVLRGLAILAALSFYAFPLTLSPLFSARVSSPFTLSLSPVRSAHAERTESAPVSTSTREGRLAVFDDAWSRINERYYDQTFRGLDWDAQRAVFRVLAADAGSNREFYAVLRRMISSLNDPHTRVFAPEEKFDWWRPRFVTIGVGVNEVEGLPTVVQLEPGSAPQRAGIRVGDVIETVNGAPALALIKDRLAKSPSPAASVRVRAFGKLLDGAPETSVEVGWRGKDGKRKSARFARYWRQRELGLRINREKGDYVVVEIDAFTKPIAATFTRAIKDKLARARGVILDLRMNGGGDAEAMTDIASTFLAAGLSLGQFTDRAGSSFTISTHSRSLFAPDFISQTNLPLIVLTSERTSSASEIFVEALKLSKRATTIGTQTCGCVLAVRTRHELPDGGLLDVSEMDYETARGDRLEGHGLKPDETVLVQRSDLYSGRDRALELAVDRLSRPLMVGQRAGPSPPSRPERLRD